MTNYRRPHTHGGYFFFTVVTHNRLPFLCTENARSCLRTVWRETQLRYPFKTVAICLLPEHLHTVWELPDGDGDFSMRWRMIKGLFTNRFREADSTCSEQIRNQSRRQRREQAVWQRRFGEHMIRDEIDLQRHIDYIHFNPVKHGHVVRPGDWEWSSFRKFQAEGLYHPEWGIGVSPQGIEELICVGSEPGELG